MSDGLTRRRFLKVLGATGAGSAALGACADQPAGRLIPYLVPVEDQIPGIPTYYATTCRECPAGCGLHVKTREGRAIKVDGNPDHPINRGKTCARAQASTQGLYNPDRVRGPLARTQTGEFQPITWDDAIARVVATLRGVPGSRVRFLTGHQTGSFERLVATFLEGIGAPARLSFEPFNYAALQRATRDVFGVNALPVYDFGAARYVLSFGADFLETWLSPVEYGREFANGHAFQEERMGRFVHVEPRMSMTAMNADEWIAPVPGSEGAVAMAVAHVIVRDRLARTPAGASAVRRLLEAYTPQAVSERSGVAPEVIERLAREFAAGPSVAVGGGVGAQHENGVFAAAASHVLNYVAGNVGRTVRFDSQAGFPGGLDQVAGLAQAMEGGQVEVLLLHDANPVYATPPGTDFADAMGSVRFKVSFSRYLDETSRLCDLVLPDHDFLEQWNDWVPRSGIYALQQPVMQPVFDTRQTGDVLLAVARDLGGNAARRLTAESYEAYLKDAWRPVQRAAGNTGAFDLFWNDALSKGGVFLPQRSVTVSLAASAARLRDPAWAPAPGTLTLLAYPSPVFYDGRPANRPWLQELPDPVTKITWSSWIEIHPDTAASLGIAEGDHVAVTSPAGTITVPAYLYPGIRPDTVAMPFGQGHTAYGRYATGVGANAWHLLSPPEEASGHVYHYTPVTLAKTGVHERLAKTEGNPRQMGRGVARTVTLAALAAGQAGEHHAEHAAPVPEHIEELLEEIQEEQYHDFQTVEPYAGEHPRWGMAIDLSRCTGCSACVTACYAENNIPHAGKEAARRGRELSWLRIERYFDGGGEDPLQAEFLPMLCQHCFNAPCEPVCPVFAAYHTPDGLNGQVYNRCVGTRYCSNNCPYKVRYFNWYDYSDAEADEFAWPDPLHLLLNPDVTVRSKGVMEKCTFCVQRIRAAQHEARMRGSALRDGEIATACQQACPADAIVFGDMKDQDSRVSRLARQERGYHVLDGLNTRPGITYLARVRNTGEA